MRRVVNHVMAISPGLLRELAPSEAERLQRVAYRQFSAIPHSSFTEQGAQARFRDMPEGPQAERFLAYNYVRCQELRIRQQLHLRSLGLALSLLALEASRIERRNALVEEHFGLVGLSLKKVQFEELDDMRTEYSIALIRAVDGFDVSRRSQFSTYAMKALWRAGLNWKKASFRRLSRCPCQLDESLPLPDLKNAGVAAARLEAAEELKVLLARAGLSAREKNVLSRGYGYGAGGRTHGGARHRDDSFDEIAASLNLSRQRVKQIEQGALRKLREAAKCNGESEVGRQKARAEVSARR